MTQELLQDEMDYFEMYGKALMNPMEMITAMSLLLECVESFKQIGGYLVRAKAQECLDKI